MKLPLCLLEQYIDLPTKNEHELRLLLDELGLEVEDVLHEKGEVFFKIETLAHRGDHLYALGIARELSAHLLRPTKIPVLPAQWSVDELSLPVRILTEKCLGYILLQVDLPKTMVLPQGVETCMNETGKHPLVSLINYSFLELGQPLHAFDKDLVKGSITVCESLKEEVVLALDGKEYRVPVGSILIKDEEKILAVAGVIGCANSMVTPQTKCVLIESATFDPVAIRKTAKKMGISTDASYAFERGCDSAARIPALKRVVQLISEASSTSLDHFSLCWHWHSPQEEMRAIPVSFDLVRKQGHLPNLSNSDIVQRLTLLGYVTKQLKDDTYSVIPPTWRRWNVLTEGSIIEDCLRVVGFNQLPLLLPPVDTTPLLQSTQERILEKIEQAFLGHGFFEVISRSYYSNECVSLLQALDPTITAKHISIKNSIDKENGYLKVTNCLHLARLADLNLRKGVSSVKIYEFARLFCLHTKEEQGPYAFERDVFSFAVAGRWYDNEWKKGESVEEKLFHLKGVLESYLEGMGLSCRFAPSAHPFLHPGCQASLFCGGKEVGFFGLLHPQLKTQLNVLEDVLYAEIDVAIVTSVPPLKRSIEAISEYPSIKRDVTFKQTVASFAEEVSEKLFYLKPLYLQAITIRDSFKKGDEPFRRVTYRLHFQSVEKTLSHEDVDALMEDILRKAKEQFSLEIA